MQYNKQYKNCGMMINYFMNLIYKSVTQLTKNIITLKRCKFKIYFSWERNTFKKKP